MVRVRPLDVVRAFNTQTGFNWTNANASVAFHTYNTAGSSASITQLRSAGYTVVNTEQNLPNYETALPMDGEGYGQQTMERLGISWFAWTANGFGTGSQYATQFLPGPIADAKSKGYYWVADNYSTLPGTIGSSNPTGNSAGKPTSVSDGVVSGLFSLNAASGILNVFPPDEKRYNLTIFNLEGKTVCSETMQSGSSFISVKGFSKGLYLLNLENSSGRYIEKMVK